MIKKEVESSNIALIGYDKESKVLEIEFKNGGIYQYFKVPEEEYDDLIKAESHGSYFNRNIGNSYKWQKIDE